MIVGLQLDYSNNRQKTYLKNVNALILQLLPSLEIISSVVFIVSLNNAKV